MDISLEKQMAVHALKVVACQVKADDRLKRKDNFTEYEGRQLFTSFFYILNGISTCFIQFTDLWDELNGLNDRFMDYRLDYSYQDVVLIFQTLLDDIDALCVKLNDPNSFQGG